MLLPITLICDQRARRDGTNAIRIQYCHTSKKRAVLPTEIFIPIGFWSKKCWVSKDLPNGFGDFQTINERLNLLLRIAQDIVSFALKNRIEDPVDFLKKTFHPNLNVALHQHKAEEVGFINVKKGNKTNLDLYFQIDDYINSKEKRFAKICRGYTGT